MILKLTTGRFLHEDNAETVVQSEFLEVTELNHGSWTGFGCLASVYLRAQLEEGQQGGRQCKCKYLFHIVVHVLKLVLFGKIVDGYLLGGVNVFLGDLMYFLATSRTFSLVSLEYCSMVSLTELVFLK